MDIKDTNSAKVKVLIYCMIEAYEDVNFREHPQDVMKKLGIKYYHAVPQSLNDSWEFWLPKNIPDSLPSFLNIVELNPFDRVGWGLDEKLAKLIYEKYESK